MQVSLYEFSCASLIHRSVGYWPNCLLLWHCTDHTDAMRIVSQRSSLAQTVCCARSKPDYWFLANGGATPSRRFTIEAFDCLPICVRACERGARPMAIGVRRSAQRRFTLAWAGPLNGGVQGLDRLLLCGYLLLYTEWGSVLAASSVDVYIAWIVQFTYCRQTTCWSRVFRQVNRIWRVSMGC